MAAFIAILAAALAVGLNVGFETRPLFGVLAAVATATATALLLAAVYRVRPVRHAVMNSCTESPGSRTFRALVGHDAGRFDICRTLVISHE